MAEKEGILLLFILNRLLVQEKSSSNLHLQFSFSKNGILFLFSLYLV